MIALKLSIIWCKAPFIKSLSEILGEARRRGASSGVCTLQMSSEETKGATPIRGFRIGSKATMKELVRLMQQDLKVSAEPPDGHAAAE